MCEPPAKVEVTAKSVRGSTRINFFHSNCLPRIRFVTQTAIQFVTQTAIRFVIQTAIQTAKFFWLRNSGVRYRRIPAHGSRLLESVHAHLRSSCTLGPLDSAQTQQLATLRKYLQADQRGPACRPLVPSSERLLLIIAHLQPRIAMSRACALARLQPLTRHCSPSCRQDPDQPAKNSGRLIHCELAIWPRQA